MAYHPIIQKVDELLSRVPLNHQQVVLASTQKYLLLLNILVVYGSYWFLSNLITICKYLLLRSLLSDRYNSLFCKVIMFLTDLAKWPIQYMSSGFGIIILHYYCHCLVSSLPSVYSNSGCIVNVSNFICCLYNSILHS